MVTKSVCYSYLASIRVVEDILDIRLLDIRLTFCIYIITTIKLLPFIQRNVGTDDLIRTIVNLNAIW